MAIVMKSRLLIHPFWNTTAEICYSDHSPLCFSHLFCLWLLITHLFTSLCWLLFYGWCLNPFSASEPTNLKYMISIFMNLAFSQCLRLLSHLCFFYQSVLKTIWNLRNYKRQVSRRNIILELGFLKLWHLLTQLLPLSSLSLENNPNDKWFQSSFLYQSMRKRWTFLFLG